jgi:uncharacterized protein
MTEMANEKGKLVLAGGTGFCGQILERYFHQLGYSVVVLTRDKAKHTGPGLVATWDGETLGDWCQHLEGSAAVINLSGLSVNCRYTQRNRQLLHSSRLLPTRVIAAAIAACASPPAVWMNASTATLYRHNTSTTAWTEADTDFTAEPAAKDAYSIQLAMDWEAAFYEAEVPAHVRRVALRSAMVLGHGENSVYPVLQLLARVGLGGKMGSGSQWVSWMHELDFCRAIHWILDHTELSGPINLAAPQAERNADMMKLFRQSVSMPLGLPAAPWMLEVGAYLMRTETELILKSRHVSPAKLQATGFTFTHPSMKAALQDLSAR